VLSKIKPTHLTGSVHSPTLSQSPINQWYVWLILFSTDKKLTPWSTVLRLENWQPLNLLRNSLHFTERQISLPVRNIQPVDSIQSRIPIHRFWLMTSYF
jgi:hypothetical protein